MAFLSAKDEAAVKKEFERIGGPVKLTVFASELGGEQNALWITLLLMGMSVILLGVGWHRARRAVMRFVPYSLARHLPVVRA